MLHYAFSWQAHPEKRDVIEGQGGVRKWPLKTKKEAAVREYMNNDRMDFGYTLLLYDWVTEM